MSGKNAHANLPWANLPFFLALGRHKTLSAAGRALATDRTTVGRRIEKLEAAVSQPLFDRQDGVFELTRHGRRCFAAAEVAEQELRYLARGASSNEKQRYALGKVRLSLSAQFCGFLSPFFANFLRDNPEIQLELDYSDRFASLKRFEADFALRLSRKPPSALLSISLGQPVFQLYRCRDTDVNVEGFLTHPGAENISKFVQELYPSAEIAAFVDGFPAMREMIAAGAGFGMLPTFIGEADHRLVSCSDPAPSLGFELLLLCLPEQKRIQRNGIFFDYFRKNAPQIDQIVTG